MPLHTIELALTIMTTAVTVSAIGWKLLDLRFGKFQGELIDKLNGRYIGRGECSLLHKSTGGDIKALRFELQRIRERME